MPRRFLMGALALFVAVVSAPISPLYANKSTTFDADQYVTESRDPYFWDRVFRKVTPNRAPYMTLLAQMPQRRVDSQRFYHFSESVIGHVANLTATITAGATTINVNDGTLFIKDYACFFPKTGEIFKVTSVAGNALTVTRGFGGTAAAITFTQADDKDMHIIVLGNVSQEGSDAPETHWNETENDYNIIMEHRRAWDQTTLAGLTKGLRGPKQASRMQKIEMTRFKEEQERFGFFGKRSKQTISSAIFRMTGGLQEWIEADSTRVKDFAGSSPSEELFQNVSRAAFDNVDGAISNMTAFVGPDVISALNDSRVATTRLPTGKTFGIRTMRYSTNHGTITFVVHRQLVGYYAGWAFMLPLRETRKVHMAGIKTDRNMQTPGSKTKKTGFYQPWGLDRGLKQHMMIVKGIGTDDI